MWNDTANTHPKHSIINTEIETSHLSGICSKRHLSVFLCSQITFSKSLWIYLCFSAFYFPTGLQKCFFLSVCKLFFPVTSLVFKKQSSLLFVSTFFPLFALAASLISKNFPAPRDTTCRASLTFINGILTGSWSQILFLRYSIFSLKIQQTFPFPHSMYLVNFNIKH